MMPATRLVLSHFWVAVAAFAVGCMMAVMQALARTGIELPFGTASLYYLSVTAHGVLLALVFTTFFIMALGYLVAETTLGGVAGPAWAWAGFWIAVVGTLVTTGAILSGTSTVLYTFYPPLLAHPAFYFGATLIVVGSWIWCGVMIGSYRSWRTSHALDRVPLPAHGMIATVAIWVLATTGLAVVALVGWWLSSSIQTGTDAEQQHAEQAKGQIEDQSAKLASVCTELAQVRSEVGLLRAELGAFIHGPPSLRSPLTRGDKRS